MRTFSRTRSSAGPAFPRGCADRFRTTFTASATVASGPTTVGPNSGGTFSGWTTSSNAGASDNAYASATIAESATAPFVATNFGFAIPAGKTIKAVLVEVECKKSTGTNTTLSYSQFQRFGAVLTPDDLNDPTFGVRFVFLNLDATPTGITIDHVRISVVTTDTPVTVIKTPGTSSGWTNSGNVTASDDVYATATAVALGVTPTLVLSNFGFSVPAGKTIKSVAVFVEGKCNNNSCPFNNFQLRKAGVAAGTAKTNQTITTFDTLHVRGNLLNDLWGTTLTPADVNDSGFGVQVYLTNFDDTNPGSASIDQVRLAVVYE